MTNTVSNDLLNEIMDEELENAVIGRKTDPIWTSKESRCYPEM